MSDYGIGVRIKVIRGYTGSEAFSKAKIIYISKNISVRSVAGF